MYWFRRPPYLRWALAALIVAFATIAELRGEATVAHPFVAARVDAGRPVEASALEWRRVPPGLLPAADPDGGVATRSLHPGEPLLPSSLGAAAAAPAGWWSVPLEVPRGAPPGAEVMVVVVTVDGVPEAPVPGLVMSAGGADPFGAPVPGLVAVPGERAGAVAAAAVSGQAVVLLAAGAAGGEG